MELLQYIESTTEELDLAMAPNYEIFGSQKRFHRLINNNPERATLLEIIRLSRRLHLHPLTLIEKYGMGKLMITEDDRTDLRLHYRIEPQTALRDVTTHVSPAPCAEVAGANP